MNRGQLIFVGIPGALDVVLMIPVVPFLSTGKIIETSSEGCDSESSDLQFLDIGTEGELRNGAHIK
jgi:hypothetical protein